MWGVVRADLTVVMKAVESVELKAGKMVDRTVAMWVVQLVMKVYSLAAATVALMVESVAEHLVGSKADNLVELTVDYWAVESVY